MSDDDRFRNPGSQYADDEPIAFAAVGASERIDWSSLERVPAHTVWIPETLFDALRVVSTALAGLNKYGQNRLTCEACRQLIAELRDSRDCEISEVREAAALIATIAEQVMNSPEATVLLVEGP